MSEANNAEPAMVPTFADGVLTVPFRVKVTGWPDLVGTVRPATAGEIRKYDGRCRVLRDTTPDPANDPNGYEKAVDLLTAFQCEFYARHLKTINVAGEVTPQNIGGIPDQFFQHLDIAFSY